jgi:hypothetical protein
VGAAFLIKRVLLNASLNDVYNEFVWQSFRDALYIQKPGGSEPSLELLDSFLHHILRNKLNTLWGKTRVWRGDEIPA